MNARTALVTGANRGLGLAACQRLLEAGFQVFLGSRDQARGEEAADLLRRNVDGALVSAVALDVTDEASVSSTAEHLEGLIPHLDALVNNAGISGPRVWPSEQPTDAMKQTFEVNFFGPHRVTRSLLPLLRAAPAARIVNVSTSSGSLGNVADPQWPYLANASRTLGYSASKAALNMETIQLAYELRDTKMKVNAICPGYTATAFNAFKGTRDPLVSAQIIVTYATLEDDGPTGGFFDEQGAIRW